MVVHALNPNNLEAAAGRSCELGASLVYKVNSRTATTVTEKPCLEPLPSKKKTLKRNMSKIFLPQRWAHKPDHLLSWFCQPHTQDKRTAGNWSTCKLNPSLLAPEIYPPTKRGLRACTNFRKPSPCSPKKLFTFWKQQNCAPIASSRSKCVQKCCWHKPKKGFAHCQGF